MNNLITIENVKGYLDPVTGTAYLNAEDVARGFGFTTVAKSGNAVIRWARVNRYLSEFGLSKEIGKDDYIPENMVYRLGFRASNGTAKRFQAKLADEVIPAIRKTGMYMTDGAVQNILNNPTAFIEILTEYKKVQDENKSLAVQNARPDGREAVKMNTKWTQKGRLFLYDTLKKEDIVPIIERGA